MYFDFFLLVIAPTYLKAENSWSLVPSKLLRVRNILAHAKVLTSDTTFTIIY